MGHDDFVARRFAFGDTFKMNIQGLIDAVIQYAMSLVATLATARNTRYSLSHIETRVFFHLSQALEKKDIGKKVIADMLGMSLRTYQARHQQLKESRSLRGKSLWEAIVEHLMKSKGAIDRHELLHRFRYDSEANVLSVLRDLKASELVKTVTNNKGTAYQLRHTKELRELKQSQLSSMSNLLWVVIHRSPGIFLDELKGYFPSVDPMQIDEAIAELKRHQRIIAEQDRDGTHLHTHSCVLAKDDDTGLSGAILDHFRATVDTISLRLTGEEPSGSDTLTGGSTFHFDIDAHHPFRNDVERLFGDLRERASQLAFDVEAYNQGLTGKRKGIYRVVFYAGQHVSNA